MITDHLSELVTEALERAARDGLLESQGPWSVAFERPKRKEHGDWATNIALTAARGADPRKLAQALIERLPASELVDRVEVAGPGFLNFHLAGTWLHDVVRRAADPYGGFGRSREGDGIKVNVEYVSANPTGPMNVVNGRHAAVGDAIAGLLDATGHEVTREYYFNDAGRQVELFGDSVMARYLQHFGVEAPLPEEGYRGEDVVALAEAIAGEVGDRYVHASDDERREALRALAAKRTLEGTRASLERFGTRFDVWTSEANLHEDGAVEEAVARLKGAGFVEERDGALWFIASRLGDDKDRVLVRSSGAPTYLAADVGYLVDKFERGFDSFIYLWGADHHGTVVRLRAAAEALGVGRERVEVLLMQIVSLVRGGQALRASKRAGLTVTLDELLDEVGPDAARYTFLTRSMEAPLEFDIELAKEQAPENPVFYVQYAHARICSILRKAEEQGLTVDIATAPLERCDHPSEDALMRKLASYEEVVPDAARLRAPQRITRFVEELASTFSAFYRDCRVVSGDKELSRARLALCVATKSVIADGLGLLGVRAPERM